MTEPNEAPHVTEARVSTGMPRWVKVSLLVVAVLIATFVVLNLLGVGGQHLPGRHMRPMNHGAPATIDV